MTRVLATGTFDLLHPGHEFFLREAKRLGDHLTVIVSRDETVRTVKGRTPTNGENARLAGVRATGIADEAVLGRPGPDKLAIVLKLRPDVIALGYDQRVFTDSLAERLAARGLPNVRIVRLPSFQPEKFKSAFIRERLERDGKL